MSDLSRIGQFVANKRLIRCREIDGKTFHGPKFAEFGVKPYPRIEGILDVSD